MKRVDFEQTTLFYFLKEHYYEFGGLTPMMDQIPDIDFDFLKPTLSQKNFFDHFQSGNQHRMNLSKVVRKPFQNQKVPYKEALVTERPVFSIIWCFAQISLKNLIEIVYGSVVLMLLFGF